MNKLIKTFLICIVCTSCNTVEKKTSGPLNWPPHLHNHPTYLDKCPPYLLRSYDKAKVKKLAEQANMRPVDYLHRMNNKRYKTRILNNEEK